MIFADKLIHLRKKAGWSQEELAEQMNVTRQSVSKWEGVQSVPDLEKMVRLSELFEVSTDYLLKDEIENVECLNPSEDIFSLKRVSKREKQKRASNPLRVECSFTGSPCWTRTNDPFGQKHSRPARLERFARLLVSSCASIACSRHRRRQSLRQFTAAMRLPKHKIVGLRSARRTNQNH